MAGTRSSPPPPCSPHILFGSCSSFLPASTWLTVSHTRAAPPSPAAARSSLRYYTDLGNIRFFRLWLSLYVGSQEDKSKRALLLQFEDDNFCCGWGPPLQCTNVGLGCHATLTP